eukprot:m.154219 g.154219  ORF g.154219 m.154219 type:complete len:73 (-) comp20781_c3_seq2:79-297(-)
MRKNIFLFSFPFPFLLPLALLSHARIRSLGATSLAFFPFSSVSLCTLSFLLTFLHIFVKSSLHVALPNALAG